MKISKARFSREQKSCGLKSSFEMENFFCLMRGGFPEKGEVIYPEAVGEKGKIVATR
jgi:hypothetical protein